MKNCAPTGNDHMTGCLSVDDPHENVKGTVCFCATQNCNSNYDAVNNFNSGAGQIMVPIVTIVISLSASFAFAK